MRILGVFLSLLAAMAPLSSLQAQLAVICDKTTQQSSSCTDTISGKDTLVLQFWIKNGKQFVKGGAKVTFQLTGSGTISPGIAVADTTGLASVTWIGNTKAIGSAHVTAIAEYEGNPVAQGAYTLIWALPPDNLYLIPQFRTYRGETGHVISDSITVMIGGMTKRGQDGIDECKRQRIVFSPSVMDNTNLVTGKQDTVEAGYTLGPFDTVNCYASVRWRLSGDPGDQELRAELAGVHQVPGNHFDRPYGTIRGVAYQPAGFFFGVADMFRAVTIHSGSTTGSNSVTTTTTTTHITNGTTTKDSAIVTTSSNSDTASKLGRPYQPILGIDFTVPPTLLSNNLADVFDHIRIMVATNALSPGSDFFVGAQIAPLLQGSRALDVPAQITVGVRMLPHAAPKGFVALTYEANSLLTNILSAFVPGENGM
ncbi:MAG TPA: hypothetical protein VNU46_02045 [Gemmatimonadaceae bacterium]|jgi:hypothetical protein|nr:hypothetical protein [Gemmatimonadaceae bacterium]